ncbi:MAG: hypothetical protein EDM05_000375 (plasmid) [Leptolyngbya sp. IPPAS B-1204]
MPLTPAARTVIKNALFAPFALGRNSAVCDALVTYTDPEVAHVGMYEPEARQQELRSNYPYPV